MPPLSILLVDDDEIAREAFGMLMGAWGHRVERAGSASEALAKAASDPPEVAILDLGLPDLDGHVLAARLCAGAAPRPHCIALTGYDLTDDPRARDFDTVLLKPADLDRLKSLLAGLNPPRARA